MTSTLSIPALLLVVSALALPQSTPSDCKDWKVCRELALDAAKRQDYETFHDLAWRTVNAGPRNDPALMTLLARAQSLSGRPHDALVMLNRLAAMGVATDAATNDDFARVRVLPGWAELEAKLAGASRPAAKETTTVKETPVGKETVPVKETSPGKETPPGKEPTALKETPAVKETTANAGERPSAKESSSAKAAAPKSPRGGKAAAPEPPPPLAFSSVGLTATGLAYDAVSGRFIVADGRDRRLLVLGERSGRLASLAGIDAGLGEITAIEIDSREGDLWVVSTAPSARASTLHKLQLISGRVLFSIPLPAEEGASRFTDVAITPQHVLVLDSEGRRVFRAPKKSKTLEVAARFAASDVLSLAPASDTISFAAYDRGVLKIDLSTRSSVVVDPAQPNLDLSGFTWMRWHRGALVAIQKGSDGSFRLVRVRLDEAGRTVRAIEALDEAVVPAGPTAVTIAENVLYCLSKSGNADELAIKKIALK